MASRPPRTTRVIRDLQWFRSGKKRPSQPQDDHPDDELESNPLDIADKDAQVNSSAQDSDADDFDNLSNAGDSSESEYIQSSGSEGADSDSDYDPRKETRDRRLLRPNRKRAKATNHACSVSTPTVAPIPLTAAVTATRTKRQKRNQQPLAEAETVTSGQTKETAISNTVTVASAQDAIVANSSESTTTGQHAPSSETEAPATGKKKQKKDWSSNLAGVGAETVFNWQREPADPEQIPDYSIPEPGPTVNMEGWSESKIFLKLFGEQVQC